MPERKRLENVEITSLDENGVKVRSNGGPETAYEFSKYNKGEKPENLKVGQKINAAIYRDKYLADIEVVAESNGVERDPSEAPACEGDEVDRILRIASAKIAATVLTTRGEPVYLNKLFKYARWVELALRRGFEAAMEELDQRAREHEESRAKGAAEAPKKQPETATAK